MTIRPSGDDVPTPITDALAKTFARDEAECKLTSRQMLNLLWEHAREMERRANAYRAIAVAEMKP